MTGEDDRHARTRLLLGDEALLRLRSCTAAVVGLGGVGSFAAEALCRSGVGTLILIDGDVVDASNLNRQLFATSLNIGRPKAEEAQKRLSVVDPDIQIFARCAFLTAQNAAELLNPRPDVIVDAIDRMTNKIDLIEYANQNGIPILSAGGAGNRLCAQGMLVKDVFATQFDPLCRIMRRELRARGIGAHRVATVPAQPEQTSRPPGSMVFVPGAMGLMLAQAALETLLNPKGDKAL